MFCCSAGSIFARVLSKGLGTPEVRERVSILAGYPEAAGFSGASSSWSSWLMGLSSDGSSAVSSDEASLRSASGGGEPAWRAALSRLARLSSTSGLDGSGGEAGGEARRTCFFVRTGTAALGQRLLKWHSAWIGLRLPFWSAGGQSSASSWDPSSPAVLAGCSAGWERRKGLPDMAGQRRVQDSTEHYKYSSRRVDMVGAVDRRVRSSVRLGVLADYQVDLSGVVHPTSHPCPSCDPTTELLSTPPENSAFAQSSHTLQTLGPPAAQLLAALSRLLRPASWPRIYSCRPPHARPCPKRQQPSGTIRQSSSVQVQAVLTPRACLARESALQKLIQ